MTMDTAYAALTLALGAALQSGGFLEDATSLQVDPAAAFEPEGLDGSPQKTAALFNVETTVARTLMGGPTPRFVVERRCDLELSVAAAEPEDQKTHLAYGLAAAASLVAGHADATLGGACERLTFEGVQPVPDEAAAQVITFRLRVRSGDPLGLTP